MAKNRKIAEFIPRNKVNSEAANFVALVAGMSATLLIMLIIWNVCTAPANSGRTSAATEAEHEDGVDSSERINPKDFEQVLKHGSVEALEKLLFDLNAWNGDAPLTVQVDENLKRARVASQMLSMPLTDTQRSMAIESQITALSIVYGLDLLNNMRIPDVGPNLMAAAESHLADSDLRIARSSRLAFAKVKCYEFFKNFNSDNDPQPIVTLIMDLLHDFPDDEQVLSTVNVIVMSLPKFNRALGQRILNSICQKSSEFSSAKEQVFFRELRDEVLLLESNFEALLDDRWVNGEAGQRELLKVALALARDTTGAENLLNKVDSVANWFEQINQLDQARQIYQAFLDSEPVRSTADLRELVHRLGKDGIRRCELIGRKLEISGPLTLGGSLEPAEAANRIVVIIFWSENDLSSMKTLKDFHGTARELVAKNVLVLAVCTDAERESAHMRFANSLSSYRFIDYTTASHIGPSLLDQYPTGLLPKAVVVDQQGIVIDANSPIDELVSATSYLLNRQQ